MAETKKTLLEIMNDAKGAINQFAFMVFIANPMNHSVRYWVDDGSIQSVMDTNDFLNTLKNILDGEEINKIYLACCEYGVPYIYDRHKKMLMQLNEKGKGRDMNIKSGSMATVKGGSDDDLPTLEKLLYNVNQQYSGTLDRYGGIKPEDSALKRLFNR